MWRTFSMVVGWLRNNEWLALWAEGIALVLIFIWDRKDARDAHKETLKQIEIAGQQAEAARITAQSMVNSERAWLTAFLEWPTSEGRVLFSDFPPDMKATDVVCVLRLKNDGRTPAWIELISAGMEISGGEKQPEIPTTAYVEPLGAGKERSVELTLHCPGKPKMLKSEHLSIHITVRYRDIFENQVMNLEFFVHPLTNVISRLEKAEVDFTSNIALHLRKRGTTSLAD
jgi:hypothetical protein